MAGQKSLGAFPKPPFLGSNEFSPARTIASTASAVNGALFPR